VGFLAAIPGLRRLAKALQPPRACPFCKSTDTGVKTAAMGGGHRVQCNRCLAAGPVKRDKASAVVAWNQAAARG
jgi:hypothetical protein